jgi:hypothetical protein
MSPSKESRVFILGAGCSVECGYPPGTGLKAALKEFLHPIFGNYPRIEQSVTDTIKLLEELPEIETLDQLASYCDESVDEWTRKQGGIIEDEAEFGRRMRWAAKHIQHAKIATSAMFLAREEAARRTGLPRHKQFIAEILGGGGAPWQDALRESSCQVLTFNYDQLFEIAFLEAFRSFDSRSHFLYGQEALNSGFLHYGDCKLVDPAQGRFCFLKLHGSVGWWVERKTGGGKLYSVSAPVKALSLAEIEGSIPGERDPLSGPEPLMAFPHERQGSQKYLRDQGKSSDYLWAPYIDAVWQHAASIVANATEVRVVGYSFNPIDSRYMVNELLSKATCEKIVIQNKADVRRNLETYRQFKGRLEYDPTPFGE